MAKPTLQLAFNFTDEDLAANERGEITPHQQAALPTTWRDFRLVVLIFGGILLIPVCGVYGQSNPEWTLFLGGIFIIILGYHLWRWYRERRFPVLQSEDDIVIKYIAGRLQGKHVFVEFFLEIHNQIFPITAMQYDAIEHKKCYTIYYDAHRNHIYSITHSRFDKPLSEKELLERVFHFRDDDLTMNSNGQISSEQLRHMHKNIRDNLKLGTNSMIFYLIIYFPFACFIFSSRWIWIGVGMLLIVLFSYWKFLKLFFNRHNIVIVQIEGICQKPNDTTKYFYNTNMYPIVVNDMKFRLWGQQYHVLAEGAMYRIYYDQITKYIVSVEKP
jgi:hypothetical protein